MALADLLQLYENSIKSMSVADRLQLIKLVMDDLMRDTSTWLVSESSIWSEEDYTDLTHATLVYADESLDNETDHDV